MLAVAAKLDAFLAAIIQDPSDVTTLLICGDFLEESGDLDRAKVYRQYAKTMLAVDDGIYEIRELEMNRLAMLEKHLKASVSNDIVDYVLRAPRKKRKCPLCGRRGKRVTFLKMCLECHWCDIPASRTLALDGRPDDPGVVPPHRFFRMPWGLLKYTK